MKINRNNYEEFFLLYIDDELSITDRQEVEHFAEENADLKSELKALQQTTLRPDKKVLFENKDALLQFSSGKECINAANYQQHFVLYLDNELDQAEKAAVEEFVYRHPQYQEEFELMQELRLAPDLAVVYEDKKSLYHFQGGNRIIIPWWRIAAAAVVFLVAGMLWLKMQPDISPSPEFVRVEASGSAVDSIKGREQAVKSPLTANTLPEKTEIAKAKEATVTPASRNNTPQLTVRINKKPVQDKVKDDQEVADLTKNNTPEKVPIEEGVSNQLPVNTALASEEITPALAGAKLVESPAQAEKTVSYENEARVALMETPEDENTFFTNITIGRKSPVSRVFRKASRFIQKTTDIATGRKAGIQIGNIEIAFQ